MIHLGHDQDASEMAGDSLEVAEVTLVVEMFDGLISASTREPSLLSLGVENVKALAVELTFGRSLVESEYVDGQENLN